jgi:predicted amidohydrolase YtcJ
MNKINRSGSSIIATLMVSSLLLAGCGSSSSENQDTTTAPKTTNPTSEIATQVYKNGKVYTVNDQQEWADAVAVKDNKIIFVGSNDEVQDYVDSSTKVTDLSGKMMMPGFHDVHMHPIESASENTQFAISVDETNSESFIASIKKASLANPGKGWLIGFGHSIFTLLDSARSPLAIIDEAVSDRPVIIMEQTSHSMWVNSAALALAGFTKDSPHPTGARILRDENTGELNGILIDNAGNMVMDIAMAPTSESLQKDYDGLIEFTLPELAKHGITSISDARSFWKRDDHTTWLKAQKNDAITARVSVGLWAYPTADDNAQLADLKAAIY